MRAWSTGLSAAAGLFGAAGVGLAAIGAHRSASPNVITAAYFLLFHASAIIALCAFARSDRAILAAASLIALGSLLFSGALATHALAGLMVPGAAPTGGMLMIAGWLVATVAMLLAFRRRP